MTSLLTETRRESDTQGVIALNDKENQVWMDGEPCYLTAQEYRLLRALACSAPEPCTRDELLCTAWGYVCPGKSRTVDVHVQRLRRKMGETLFETIHGVGYRLLAEPIQT